MNILKVNKNIIIKTDILLWRNQEILDKITLKDPLDSYGFNMIRKTFIHTKPSLVNRILRNIQL